MELNKSKNHDIRKRGFDFRFFCTKSPIGYFQTFISRPNVCGACSCLKPIIESEREMRFGRIHKMIMRC